MRHWRGRALLATIVGLACHNFACQEEERPPLAAAPGTAPPEPGSLVEPGEAALMLDVPPGMPLGVGGEPFEEVEVELPEGALLALYTDGLVESRDHPLDEGLQAFVGALTDPTRPLEDVCDQVLNTLDTHHGEDDIALLMARVQGLPAESVGDWTLPREPRSVGRAREYARGRAALVSQRAQRAREHGLGDARQRHAELQRVLRGPPTGALLLGLVDDHVDERLAGLRVLLGQHGAARGNHSPVGVGRIVRRLQQPLGQAHLVELESQPAVGMMLGMLAKRA